MFTDIFETEEKIYMKNVSKIDSIEWLYETGYFMDKSKEVIE